MIGAIGKSGNRDFIGSTMEKGVEAGCQMLKEQPQYHGVYMCINQANIQQITKWLLWAILTVMYIAISRLTRVCTEFMIY